MPHRIRFSFSRGTELQYLSHLDLMRLFIRALRRASLPLAYTQGFNPHPRLSLASPLPVGVTASAEYGEIFLSVSLDCDRFLRTVGEQLPPGLKLTGAVTAAPQESPLAAVINAAVYRAAWVDPESAPSRAVLERAIESILARPSIEVRRRSKAGREMLWDIRPFIIRIEMIAGDGDSFSPGLELLLQIGSRGGVSPFVVLDQFSLGPYHDGDAVFPWQLHRCGLYIYRDGLEKPF